MSKGTDAFSRIGRSLHTSAVLEVTSGSRDKSRALRRVGLGLAVLFVLVAAGQAGAVATRYDLVQFGPAGSLPNEPWTYLAGLSDINNHGLAVGSMLDGDGHSHAYFFDVHTGQATEVHSRVVAEQGTTQVGHDITDTDLRSVNDAGIAAGSLTGGIYWDTSPIVVDLSQPVGSQTYYDEDYRHQNGAAAAINDSNRVIASQIRFFDYSNGAVSNVQGPLSPGGLWTTVRGMNNAGLAVGIIDFNRAYIYDTNSGSPDIVNLHAAIEQGLGATLNRTELKAVNDNNIAIGSGTIYSPYASKAIMVDLDTMAVTNLTSLVGPDYYLGVNDINNAGEILGYTYDYASGTNDPILIRDGAVINIEQLVDLPSELVGTSVDLEYSSAINDHGYITAVGTVNGQNASFALIPKVNAQLNGAKATTEYVPYVSLMELGDTGLPDLSTFLCGGISIEDLVIDNGFYTLIFYLNPSEVAALGADAEQLRLYWHDPNNLQWYMAGNPSNIVHNPNAGLVFGAPTDVLGDYGVNVAENYVWANLDHASVFTVAGPRAQQQTPVPESRSGVLVLLAICAATALRRRPHAH